MLRNSGTIKRSKLMLYGKTQSGERIFLGVPGKFTLKKDKGAASLMTATIKAEKLMDRFIFIEALCEGKVLFEGIPDEEVYTNKNEGMYLEIVARCKKALLIDNEVMPQSIKNPSVSFFSRKFLEPLGFKIASANKKGFGQIKAKKGTSVLGFTKSFFKEMHGTLPVIKDDGSVYLLSEYTPEKIRIDERKLIKAEMTRKSYDIVSEYILPDSFTGAYNLSYKNPYYQGFTRRKYKDDPDEVNFYLYNTVKLTLEGFIKAEIYDIAECLDEKGEIESIRYERDVDGDKTVITFNSLEKTK